MTSVSIKAQASEEELKLARAALEMEVACCADS